MPRHRRGAQVCIVVDSKRDLNRVSTERLQEERRLMKAHNDRITTVIFERLLRPDGETG